MKKIKGKTYTLHVSAQDIPRITRKFLNRAIAVIVVIGIIAGFVLWFMVFEFVIGK